MLLKSKTEERRIEEYQEKRFIQWLKCNLHSRKAAAVIEVQEEMVRTKIRKALRGVDVESEN